MLIHLLSIIGVLGIVIVGMLVMTQLVSLDELGNGVKRAFITVLLVLIAVCVAKMVLLPILTSWLVALRQMLWWIAIVVFALVIALLVLRIVISKLARRPRARGGHDGGEL